jgi:hypothetical protein
MYQKRSQHKTKIKSILVQQPGKAVQQSGKELDIFGGNGMSA